MAGLAHEFDTETPFEVEFVESIGNIRKGLLAELWSTSFERVRPVRSFPSFRGQKSWNTTDIADAVCQVLIEARCDLVLVDEIHNLNLATAAGEDMSDHLKYFTEHLPATFVYAGINVERSGLFTGVRGKQIAGRCVLASTGPFPYQQEWKSLVAAMESALRLHRHQPGTLPGMDRCLHQRTGGMIGSLSHLIRAGAIMAIVEGGEAITQELLEGIPARSPVPPRGHRMTAVLELALRPLPQAVKPFPGEIVSSYVGRLADVNRLDNTALLRYITGTRQTHDVPVERLAVIAGYPVWCSNALLQISATPN